MSIPTKEKTTTLWHTGKQHARSYLAKDTTNMLGYRLIWSTTFSLMSLDQNKNIVHSDSKDKERYDFNNNERGGNTNETKQTDGTNNRSQHYKHAAKAERNFRVDLKLKSKRKY